MKKSKLSPKPAQIDPNHDLTLTIEGSEIGQVIMAARRFSETIGWGGFLPNPLLILVGIFKCYSTELSRILIIEGVEEHLFAYFSEIKKLLTAKTASKMEALFLPELYQDTMDIVKGLHHSAQQPKPLHILLAIFKSKNSRDFCDTLKYHLKVNSSLLLRQLNRCLHSGTSEILKQLELRDEILRETRELKSEFGTCKRLSLRETSAVEISVLGRTLRVSPLLAASLISASTYSDGKVGNLDEFDLPLLWHGAGEK